MISIRSVIGSFIIGQYPLSVNYYGYVSRRGNSVNSVNIVLYPFGKRSSLKGKIRLHVDSYFCHSSKPVFGRGSTCKKDNGGSQELFPCMKLRISVSFSQSL